MKYAVMFVLPFALLISTLPAWADEAEKATHRLENASADLDRLTDDSVLEQVIKSDLGKDPRMAYSNVTVNVTDTEIMLTGTVKTSTAKDQAAKIAAQNAGDRKIENQIKVGQTGRQ